MISSQTLKRGFFFVFCVFGSEMKGGTEMTNLIKSKIVRKCLKNTLKSELFFSFFHNVRGPLKPFILSVDNVIMVVVTLKV